MGAPVSAGDLVFEEKGQVPEPGAKAHRHLSHDGPAAAPHQLRGARGAAPGRAQREGLPHPLPLPLLGSGQTGSLGVLSQEQILFPMLELLLWGPSAWLWLQGSSLGHSWQQRGSHSFFHGATTL